MTPRWALSAAKSHSSAPLAARAPSPLAASCASICASRRSSAGLVLRLGARDQHVLGVRRAQQPPAVGRVDARAVGAVDVGALGLEPVEHFVDHRELAALIDLEAHLGRVDHRRHRAPDLGHRLADHVHRADQPDRGILRVVEAVEIVREEDVARHLARQRRAGFLHLGLDQAVPGLPHQRRAAEFGDAVVQRLAGLHVGDDRRAGQFLEHRFGQNGQNLVAPDHAALAVDRADPVAVAVESQSEIELLLRDERLQIARFFSSVGSG